MFDTIPIELLGKNYDQNHAFVQIHEGNTTVKGKVSLFRDLNSCQNEKAIVKWSQDVQFEVKSQWSQYCLKVKLLEDMKLHAFHLQYLNSGYILNVTKSKYSEVDPECLLCKKEPETYLHLFWYCEKTMVIWDKLIDIFEMIVDPTKNEINMQNCLLSNFNTKLLVLLTTYFKRYIFFSTFISYVPHWQHFKAFVIKMRERHYNKCKYQNKIQHHFKFWGVLVNDNAFE